MKSRKKTYGSPNLMEWQCNIKCGGATIGIHFAGGNQTAYGVNPAKYTTEDPALQAIIENSGYFREGRILLLSDVEGSGAYTIGEPSAHVEETAEEPAPTDEPAELKKVEVSCADDAKQYLMDNFGVASRNLRSLKAINDTAAQNGIAFVGI